MTQSPIAIQNVYVMLAYAFRSVRPTGVGTLDSESFDHLHDLLAEILLQGVNAQIKRGMHRDYNLNVDPLMTVRGRIDMARTSAERIRGGSQVVCEFDEYEVDTPHNRALKSVMFLLARRGEVTPKRRDELRRVIRYLGNVSDVQPSSIRWDTLNYHRANASYRLLLGVCELVVRGLLPKDSPGNSKLATWLPEEEMHALYERFLVEYFKFHHPELVPAAPKVSWSLDQPSQLGGQLPAMRTDLTLRRGRRSLIIDAKYYAKSLDQGQYGKETVRSANLYQIFTYVKNADVERDGSVSGLLLYARTDADSHPNLDVMVQGNRIGAKTLDLNQPWHTIANQLEGLAEWLDVEGSTVRTVVHPRYPAQSHA